MTIELRTNCQTTSADIRALFRAATIEIDPLTLQAHDSAFERLAARAGNEPIYGVNTGFGPMVRTPIARADLAALQTNLIRSHAVGLGAAVDPDLARAIMFARLRSLIENKSAVRAMLPQMLATLLNWGVAPHIPRKGGVGASGDLIQLAHLGLLLMGEGRAFVNGLETDAADALRGAGVEPWKPALREGLAIVNGTSGMTGLALVVCLRARRILEWSIALSCVLAEVVRADREFISDDLNAAKRHPGQRTIARRMHEFLQTSRNATAPDSGAQTGRPLQEHYSLRCVPQILGPVLECLDFVESIVYRELNSASDNPIFDATHDTISHGGNFHGEYVSFAMDTLKISLVKCSMLMERQLNFLLNDDVNKILPPFLNAGRLGVELGLQGAQFTATSSAAHNQTLAFPMSVHSISCNKDNQDVVSMGFNAGLLALEVIDNAFDISAILAVAASQAVELAGVAPTSGAGTAHLLARVRDVAPLIRRDRDVAAAIHAATRLVRETDP